MHESRSSPLVTAVIVTYQSEKTITATLAALHRCHDDGLLDAIIVDNNSTDATQDIVRASAPWAHHEFTGINNGFGRGCNLGFTSVLTRYAIFINPDAIVEPDALRTMLEFMEENANVGIVGPAIIEGGEQSAKELQHTGQLPTPLTVLRDALPFQGAHSISWPIVPGSEPTRTGWVCGAALMIRTEIMKLLGGFDPRFFLYWEEIDLCRRAHGIGYETWAVGAALAYHVGGASSPPDNTRVDGCIAKHYYQSRHYYMTKHHGAVAASSAELAEFVLLALRALVDAFRGRGMGRLRSRLQARLLSQPEPPK
jgi:N-acetylglucosaminyl-diphospho-decaprenol L-rhamnosyltransferase